MSDRREQRGGRCEYEESLHADEYAEGVVVCVLADGGWKYLSAEFWDTGEVDEAKLWW